MVQLLIHMVAILIISYLLPGVIRVAGVWAALVAAFILGIVNAVIRPILIFLTLPITTLTLGLFLLVINGLMLQRFRRSSRATSSSSQRKPGTTESLFFR